MALNPCGIEESPSRRAVRMVLNPPAMIAVRNALNTQITEQLNFTKNLIYPPHVQAIIEQQNLYERLVNPHLHISWGASSSGIILRTEAKTDTQQHEADNRKSRDEAEHAEIITNEDAEFFKTLCRLTDVHREPNEPPEIYYSRLQNSLRAKESEPRKVSKRGYSEREFTTWLRKTWIIEGKPKGNDFFKALKKYVNKHGECEIDRYSPITAVHPAIANLKAYLEYRGQDGKPINMKKVNIDKKPSMFEKQL